MKHLIQVLFINRNDSGVEFFNAVRVDIRAYDVMPSFREARRGHQTDIATADYTQVQRGLTLIDI